MNANLSELAKAFCKAQASFKTVEKRRQGYNFVYADLSDIWDMIRKPLADNGLSIIQCIDCIEGRNHVVTCLLHTSGQYVEAKTLVEFTAKKFQDVGTALTYYRRYALSAMLGIVSDQDVDDKLEKQNEIYEETKNVVSPKQLDTIEGLINGHDDIRQRMLKTYGGELKNIPAEHYKTVVSAIKKIIADKERA